MGNLGLGSLDDGDRRGSPVSPAAIGPETDAHVAISVFPKAAPSQGSSRRAWLRRQGAFDCRVTAWVSSQSPGGPYSRSGYGCVSLAFLRLGKSSSPYSCCTRIALRRRSASNFRSSIRRIFPEMVFGSSVTNSTRRTRLYGASRL